MTTGGEAAALHLAGAATLDVLDAMPYAGYPLARTQRPVNCLAEALRWVDTAQPLEPHPYTL